MKNKLKSNDLADHCFKVDEAERQYEILAPRLSWALLAALEPELSNLLYVAHNADARQTADYFCGQAFWHSKLKPQVAALVGHCRPTFHPILGTDDAYDLAYDKLFGALPPCRNCSCTE